MNNWLVFNKTYPELYSKVHRTVHFFKICNQIISQSRFKHLLSGNLSISGSGSEAKQRRGGGRKELRGRQASIFFLYILYKLALLNLLTLYTIINSHCQTP
jgi:hypothetical protein